MMKRLLTNLIGAYYIIRLKDFMSGRMPTKTQRVARLEEQQQANKMKLFYGLFVNRGDLCFDVGANIGNRIKPLLQVGARVVAIEPQVHCSRFLRYKFGRDIEIVAQGLGESEGVKDFYISTASTLSSFSTDWINAVKAQRFKAYSWTKVVQVNLTTLDRMIEKYGTPAFIKIDVEGYELDVLKGLTKPVNMISVEYTVPEQVDKLIACIEQIQKNGAAIECNFSVGESMAFASSTWLSAADLLAFIPTQAFVDTEFGDVYVRVKQ